MVGGKARGSNRWRTFAAEALRTIHWLQVAEGMYLLDLGAAKSAVVSCTV